MANDWKSRQNKAVARKLQVAPRPDGRPVRHGLFLPGWDLSAKDGALCVQEALASGLIDTRSRITFAEHQAALVPMISDKLDQIGLKGRYTAHSDWLDGRFGGRTLEFYEDEHFDFAFFDFMGCLDAKSATWIAEYFMPRVRPGASLSFTIRYNLRNDSLAQKMSSTLAPGSEFFADAKHIARSYRIGKKDTQMVIHLLAIFSLLHGWSFDVQEPLQYKDGRARMIAFRVDNLRPKAGDDKPTIYDLLKIRRPKPIRALRRPSAPKTQENNVDLKKLDAALADLTKVLPALPRTAREVAIQQAAALRSTLALASMTVGQRAAATRAANAAARALAESARSAKVVAPVKAVTPAKVVTPTKTKVATAATVSAPIKVPTQATTSRKFAVAKTRTRRGSSAAALKAWATRRANGWVHPAARRA